MNSLDVSKSFPHPRYVFAASTTSGIVTGFTTFSLLMTSEDLFGLKFSSRAGQLVGRCSRFIGGAPHRRVSLAAGLSVLPYGTACLSHQLVRGGGWVSDYPPGGAVVAGWFGGSVSLGSASFMTHWDSCKNISAYKRFCIASKLGSVTAVCAAVTMTYAHAKLKRIDKDLSE